MLQVLIKLSEDLLSFLLGTLFSIYTKALKSEKDEVRKTTLNIIQHITIECSLPRVLFQDLSF